ncbi:MAG TPA: copper chaperone PCu(A)C [Thiotrichaceae bacterium]|nr:copper chaperone PCu(A)C [Thiotrichaceae bacterium]
MKIKLVLLVLVGFLLTACDRVAPEPSSHVISIEGAYIRAMPPGQKVTALFMTMHNNSSDRRQLISASSPASDKVELYKHKKVDGMMKMGQVEAIELPKNSVAELKPGGYHLMLIGLKKDLKVDEKVLVRLFFADGTLMDIQVPVSSKYLK